MKIKNIAISVITSATLLITNSYGEAKSGWEAVNDYTGSGASNLYNCIKEGQRFENAINSYNGWSNKFGYKNGLAWERDFKDIEMDGNDHNYIDTIDLALFSGHGSRNGFYFGTKQDDYLLKYNDAKWGNNYNLEWIILDSCLVLNNSDGGMWNRWARPTVFNNLHYILSYSSTTYDVPTRGEYFVKYGMHHNWSVRDSWIKATTLSENGTTAAYLRADGQNSDTYNDHLWGHGYTSDDPSGSLVFYYSTWGT